MNNKLVLFSLIPDCHSSISDSKYTLITLPAINNSDQKRSRVPVLQCCGRI